MPRYYAALRSMTWPDAFAAAFGISVGQFYAQFDAYRATLPGTGPTAAACGAR